MITPHDIKERATKAHLSINQLMGMAGLPNSTFWRWERGHIKNPHPRTVQKISDALDAAERSRAA